MSLTEVQQQLKNASKIVGQAETALAIRISKALQKTINDWVDETGSKPIDIKVTCTPVLQLGEDKPYCIEVATEVKL